MSTKPPRACCCIPLRMAVMILSLSCFTISGLLAGSVYWWWHRLNYPDSVRKVAELWCSSFVVLSFFSFLGFCGTVLPRRLRLLIVLYEYALLAALLFKTAGTLYAVVEIFKLRDWGIEQCYIAYGVPSTSLAEKKEECEEYYNQGQIAFTIMFILFFLVDAYIFRTVARYVAQTKQDHRDSVEAKNAGVSWMASLPGTASAPDDKSAAPEMEQLKGGSV